MGRSSLFHSVIPTIVSLRNTLGTSIRPWIGHCLNNRAPGRRYMTTLIATNHTQKKTYGANAAAEVQKFGQLRVQALPPDSTIQLMSESPCQRWCLSVLT